MKTEVVLKKFTAFDDFTTKQLEFVFNNGKFIDIEKGKIILRRGVYKDYSIFLIKGSFKLTANDNKSLFINQKSPKSKKAIAQLNPSLYEIETDDECLVFVIKDGYLDEARLMDDMPDNLISKILREEDNQKYHNKLLFDFLNLLYNHKIRLPILPDIVYKVKECVENDNKNLDDFIRLMDIKPNLGKKIINLANSSLYNPYDITITELEKAYYHIGGKNIINFVLLHSLKELFTSEHKDLDNYLRDAWNQSLKTAFISSYFAKTLPEIEYEKSFMYGMLHNISSAVLIHYLEDDIYELIEDNKLYETLLMLQLEVSAYLLKRWDFSKDIIQTIESMENYYERQTKEITYKDVLNLSQLHVYLDTPYREYLVSIENSPSFKKIYDGQLTPEMSFEIIKEANEKVKIMKEIIFY